MTKRNAGDQLTRALTTLAAQSQRPRCADPADHDLWLSELSEERAQAAALCHGCPVLTECGDTARASRVTFGVWGARDYTPKPGGRVAKS
jgi:hypothetical protein